ncbi:TIM barrel protein [Picrophilus oshimae]|uniref:Endonuclease IV n=1 Tax=Picrophilus torridus (strain ATCC 700027 / DSM 9790 / JCM 10055 / NBRC 100828 / KAW 2/3) TaxID=1122961 RepID=A0A8G2L6Z0_PICTO|nr:TIM barrel protein [Picrophilus oshimae]SMD30493.1 Endonuclease IV [Picrophilus oshimae DSM 9789]
MIKFGVAGIPLTSKGRTYIDSIIDVLNLGLNSLEVQLLRVNVNDTPATEYAGMYPKDVEDSIIVDVLRPDENGNYQSVGVETEIEEDDIVQELFWNMARNYNELAEGMELAKELDVDVSIHAPYYMDMLSDDEMAEKSINHLKWAIIIGKAMGARRVITHTGFYHSGRESSMSRAISIYSDILKMYPADKGYPYIGVEATSKSDIFGTVEELLYLARAVKGIEPILNFPHIHSITNGSLIEPSNFSDLIERFLPYAHGDLYTEFAGVDYENGNEVKITAIKHGDLKFETLAEVLSVLDNDMTIISMSPLLEHDAQYMQLMYMRSLLKKYQKKTLKR